MASEGFKSGTVAIVGPPNVGKSSLLNALVGMKIAAAAPRPQTTRFIVKGVVDHARGQAVFIDTAGLLKPGNAMERGMRRDSIDSTKTADLVIWMISPDVYKQGQPPGGVKLRTGQALMVINKIDAYPKDRLKKLQVSMRQILPDVPGMSISVKTKKGLDDLLSAIFDLLPEGEPLFTSGEPTDQSMRQIAAEMIREKTLLFTRDEVPHGVAIGIDEYQERADGLHEISATLHVERESQKAIVIGKGGSMLKKIGTAARKEIERAAQARVHLTIFVKVSKDWKNRPSFLEDVGYPSARQPR